jgi:hypothetical protein
MAIERRSVVREQLLDLLAVLSLLDTRLERIELRLSGAGCHSR